MRAAELSKVSLDSNVNDEVNTSRMTLFGQILNRFDLEDVPGKDRGHGWTVSDVSGEEILGGQEVTEGNVWRNPSDVFSGNTLGEIKKLFGDDCKIVIEFERTKTGRSSLANKLRSHELVDNDGYLVISSMVDVDFPVPQNSEKRSYEKIGPTRRNLVLTRNGQVFVTDSARILNRWEEGESRGSVQLTHAVEYQVPDELTENLDIWKQIGDFIDKSKK